MSLVVERKINASPDRIWQVLTDQQQLISGDFGLAAADGSFQRGTKLWIAFDEAPDRKIPLKIVTLDAPRELSLKFSVFFGLFKLQTTIYLQAMEGGTSAEFGFGTGGFLGKSANKQMDMLRPRAEKFLNALAAAAEGA